MKQLVKRLLKPTPKFFAIIRNIALSIGAISTLIVSTEPNFPEYILDFFGKTTIVSAAVAAFISQLTTVWDIEEQK